MVQDLGFSVKASRQARSPFTSLFFEIGAWIELVHFIHSYGEQETPGLLWPQRVRFALDRKANRLFSEIDSEVFQRQIYTTLWDSSALKVGAVSGRLGCSIEGAGKRRIFAIGNYVNQRLLRPVHDWCASVLRTLPTDGTFNQQAPATRIYGMFLI